MNDLNITDIIKNNMVQYYLYNFLILGTSNLIIKVSSINRLYPGGIHEFVMNPNVSGRCNGKLFIFSESSYLNDLVFRFIDLVLYPHGFEHMSDYVYGNHYVSIFGQTDYGLLESLQTSWLKVIVPSGAFVMYVDSESSSNYEYFDLFEPSLDSSDYHKIIEGEIFKCKFIYNKWLKEKFNEISITIIPEYNPVNLEE